jgi:DNA primase catalytic core
MSKQSSDLKGIISKLSGQDIAAVAESLGMQVYRKAGAKESKALCPFHSDTKPSLVLYSTERSHYHCYACGAHGDVFELVKEKKGVDFIEAAKWLAEYSNERWPDSYLPPRLSGWRQAQEIYSKATSLQAFLLWSEERGYTPDFLRASGVGYTTGTKLVSELKKSQDRLLLDTFLSDGLVRRGGKQDITRTESSKEGYLPLDDAYDYFWGQRAVFRIDDSHGNIVGFAGRAIDSAEPKYLYTKGLKKSELLYRYQNAERTLAQCEPDAANCAHLFVVEGLMDALRLESFGLAAVALLGSRASDKQIDLVIDLAQKREQKEQILAVHVFLDPDPAGKSGARTFISDLLIKAVKRDVQLFADVIAPVNVQGELMPEADPDLFLKGLSKPDAISALSRSSIPAISFLVSELLECNVRDIDTMWTELPELARHGLLRRIELLFRERETSRIIRARYGFESSALGQRTDKNKPWVLAFQKRLDITDNVAGEHGATALVSSGMQMSKVSALRHAMNIARTSSQRRELPTDSNGWHQLDIAADIALPYLAGLLENGDSANIVPMMSYPVPRLDGEFRKKAVPSNEVLLMQQYLLNELLTPREDLPTLEEAIPAVRRRRGQVRTRTTGRNKPSKTVSFAYQIDMDVLEGRVPPRSSGMFVHYFDCWRDFVCYVDELVSSVLLTNEQVFMSRLDIRRYYDNLPRYAVHDMLRPQTRDMFILADDRDVPQIAPLFRSAASDSKSRADEVIDWLCNSSFGYKYYDFSDAEEKTAPQDRGVPQGPDLSAYLANIALFPLDKTVCDRIEELGGIAGYARYVDDLVLVSNSRENLNSLTALIESHLQKLGLELNRKHQSLPGMNHNEAREWVTAQRGGLGASILGELPFIQGSDAATDFLEVSEPMDRREALLVLANPELFDDDLSEEAAEELLVQASQARDLRYGEIVRICYWLWWLSVRDASTDADLGRGYKRRLSEVLSMPPSGLSGQSHASYWENTKILASLEGLERLLCVRADRAPGHDSDDKQRIQAGRQRLAEWLLEDGALASITSLSTEAKTLNEIRHAIELRQLCLLREATVLLKGEKQPSASLLNEVVGSGRRTSCKVAQLRHLAAVGCQDALIQIQDQPDNSAVALMHECIARLRSQRPSSARGDRLAPIVNLVEQTRMIADAETPDGKLLLQISCWLPNINPISAPTDEILQATFRSFLNCVKGNEAASLLYHRPALSTIPLGDGAECLPVPSGVSFPGLLGQSADSFVRADFLESAQIPGTWQWVEDQDTTSRMISRKKTSKAGWFVRKSDNIQLTPKCCTQAAIMFRDLWKVVSDSASDTETVVPFHGNVIIRGENYDETSILTYKLSREDVGNAAFVKIPGDGLVTKEVPKEFADVWRTGIAIADCFGFGTEGLSDDDIRITAKALVGDKESWPTETMLRIAFARLSGSSAAGYVLEQQVSSHLPRVVERMLRYMEIFGEAQEELQSQMSVLCAALVDLRASRLRFRRQFETIEAPGLACFFLSTVAGQFFGHDEVFSDNLPEHPTDSPVPIHSVVARGWWQLGSRVDPLCSIMETPPPELFLLAAGCRLHALALEYRVISVALARVIDEQSKASIEEQLTNSLPIDSDIDMAGYTIAVDRENRSALGALFAYLFRGDSPDIIAAVTPIGWTLAAGLLSGIVGDLKGVAAAIEGGNRGEARKQLLQTVRLFGRSISEVEFPFGAPEALRDALSPSTLDVAVAACVSLRELFGIRITTKQDRSFGLHGGRAQEARVKLGSVEFSLHRGQIISQQLPRERPSAPWATAGIDKDGAHLQLWSEIEAKGRLAGIEVWSKAFAGLTQLESTPPKKETPPKPVSPTKTADDSSPTEDAITPIVSVEAAQDEKPKPQGTKSSAISSDSHALRLKNLKNHQDASWQSRRKAVGNHLRVALCQMRVDKHSYQHPLHDVDINNLSSKKVDYHREPWRWDRSASDQREGKAPSDVEGRRRRILAEVIKSCDKFSVDVLLLPEYSVRPETVIWLKEYLTQRGSQLAIWAGTFRKSPNMTISGQPWFNNLEDWDAVLPVVLRKSRNDDYNIYACRKKRYASIAVNEWFNPSGSNHLEAVAETLELDAAKDLRAMLIELICSEVFMASSPSNLHSLAEYRGKLLGQLGLDSKEHPANLIMEDVKWFAESTTLTRPQKIGLNRKSIVLIPAYTTRATDYAVFGQASYLSSGLVSVFCDAASSGARGCSCFIGDNSWDDEKSHHMYEQRIGPYHGVFPGMYQQWAKERGWLGAEEQALVIADIDPIHTVPGKPRQQTLLNPMELVAHLPIIECIGSRWRAATIRRILREIDEIPATARKRSDRLSIAEVDAVSLILQRLASLETSTGPRIDPRTKHPTTPHPWLRKRHDAFQKSQCSLPHSWPFPCLIDWLLIPDSISANEHLLSGEEELPTIHVPPFSALGPDNFTKTKAD